MCVFAWVYMRVQACVPVCMPVFLDPYVCMCMFVYTGVCTYTYVYRHVYMCMCVRAVCLCVRVTPWTVARQASLSMEFSRQEYWSG